MYKSLFMMSAFLVLSLFSNAQTLAEATQKTLSERFESAESDFNAIIAKEPTAGAIGVLAIRMMPLNQL